MDTATSPAITPVRPDELSITPSPERPIIPPVRRVVGIGLPVQDRGHNVVLLFQVADREQLLDALDRLSDATWTAAQGYRAPTEYDLLHIFNDAPESTAFGRRRLREQREVA